MIVVVPQAKDVEEMWQQILVDESPAEVEADKRDHDEVQELLSASAAVDAVGLCPASQLR